MVTVRRVVFFIVSTIIIVLFVKWGFDGFEIFTKIYPSAELIDESTGRVIVQTKSSYKLGLDMVLIISIGLSALGLVVINFFKIWFAAREE
ncbi:MAG: hypothetical protein NUV92_04310 [Ignavibacteria bacterium]|nr:hypothetical protein [Ignavibacteria bacterium]MDH7526725.1 hypothetical protein [Ignavibacteria bacterium]